MPRLEPAEIGVTLLLNADEHLQSEVEKELRWDPRVRAERIAVSVRNGVVELQGHVENFFEKTAAESAALRVFNVKALASEIEVDLSSSGWRSDVDIAGAAIHQLHWHCSVPDTIKVEVTNGYVTLRGIVEWQYQKEEAERAVRVLHGVAWLSNQIVVTPKLGAVDVTAQINHALKRSAKQSGETVSVEESNGKVTLRGSVRSLSEREEANRTAWAAPGVSEVEDLITVG